MQNQNNIRFRGRFIARTTQNGTVLIFGQLTDHMGINFDKAGNDQLLVLDLVANASLQQPCEETWNEGIEDILINGIPPYLKDT